MLLKEAHSKFLNYLEVIKNKSPKTVEQYDRHLRKFNEYIDEKYKNLDNFDMSDLSLDIAEWFRSYLYEKRRTISIKTANAYMITIRSFLKFLEKKWQKSLSATAIDLIKAEDRHVEFLNQDELDRLFTAPNINTIIWSRDLAIMECIYSTGLRISELTALNKSDVNLKRREFAVRWKWRKVRVVYLTKNAATLIEKYLEKRTDWFSPLFIRHNTKKDNISELSDEKVRLTRFFITNMVKKYALKAYILKDI